MAKTYDQKCWDLADAFLADEPHLHTTDNFNELASLIQATIEDFVADKQRNYEPPDPMRHVEFPFARNH